MLQKNSDLLYTSSVLASCHGIAHGFSTRSSGDMRIEDKRNAFARLIGLSDRSVYLPEQIHGNTVVTIGSDTPERVMGADGIVLGKDNLKKLALGVIVADCVPLIFADRKGTSIAVAHAGWRGTVGCIAEEVVDQMVKLGSRPSDIMVSIGPHIGRCCYVVPEERGKKFIDVFGSDERIMYQSGGLWYMDIGYANMVSLMRVGVKQSHIDIPITCTSCQNDTFYSYRKDTRASFGEIIGMVGFL